MASRTKSAGQSHNQLNDEPLLRVINVSKRFGNFFALRDVSIEIPKKSIVLLMGPNGSGKTTLVNCISGVYKPDGGTIMFDGKNITGLPIHEIVRLGLGRSFQIPQPFMRMTVAENLLICGQDNPGESFLLSMSRKKWKDFEKKNLEKMHQVLKTIGLGDKADNLACELSGGQLKLLELGRLLMLNSKMMLLDEPIGGVNPVLAHSIFSHIVSIRNEFGTSFLIIEHRLDIAMKYVDFVYVLSAGSVVASGTPKEIVEMGKLYEVYLA